MTDKEVLKKAIQKAIDGGWERTYPEEAIPSLNYEEVFGIIYDHEFAKALWGEIPIDKSNSAAGNSINWNTTPAWHIQAMARAWLPCY